MSFCESAKQIFGFVGKSCGNLTQVARYLVAYLHKAVYLFHATDRNYTQLEI